MAWGRARWPGCRVLRELVLGERRIDLVFVTDNDVIGVETKGATDKLDRLDVQMKEYARFVPEVWLAVHHKFQDRKELGYRERNLLVWAKDGTLVDYLHGEKPRRDELSIMRLLELLWTSELGAIAGRQNVAGGPVHKQMLNKKKLAKLCARLLTGNEILREVCIELRARALTGVGSDTGIRAQLPDRPARTLL